MKNPGKQADARPQPPRRRKLSGFLRVMGLAAVVLAVPALGYGYYVIAQVQDVRERSVRTLAHSAGAIEDLVANAKTTLEKLPNRPGFACDFQHRQIRLKLEEPGSCDAVRSALEADQGRPRSVRPHRTPSGLEFFLERAGSAEGAGSAAESGTEAPVKGDAAVIRWSVRFDQLLEDIPFGKSLDVLVVADGNGHVVEQYPEPTLRAEERVARPDPLGEQEPTGALISRLRIANLQGLEISASMPGQGEAQHVRMSTLQAGTAILPVSLAGEDGTLVCQPFVVESLLDTAAPILSGGEAEQDSAALGDDAGSPWVLCGLIQRDRMVQEALQVAPYFSVFLLAVLFFGLFLMPIAKLVTMAPRERLRFADVYLLLLGTWGALMMAGVLMLSFDTYRQLGDRAEETLEDLATTVEGRLLAEIKDVYQQAKEYDEWAAAAVSDRLDQLQEADVGPADTDGPASPEPAIVGPGAAGQVPTAAGQPTIFWDAAGARMEDGAELLPAGSWDIVRLLQLGGDRDCDDAGGGLQDRTVDSAELAYPCHYPYLAQVFWMQPCDGRQVLKASIGDHNTPRVSVRQREYFQHVQTDRLWPGILPGMKGPFFVQSFRSMTTGEFYAALSLPSRLSEADTQGCSPIQRLWHLRSGEPSTGPPDCDGGEYAAIRERIPGCGRVPISAVALSTRFVSVTEPILAPGTGFAIVDGAGNALFHSEEPSALFENLVDEMRDGDRLRAAIGSRTPRHLSTHYRTAPVRVYTRPVDDLPWTIVTFEDQQVIRASHLEVLMHGSFLVLLHILAYFALTLLYMGIRGRRAPKWMWPHLSERLSDHRWMIWMLVVLIVSAIAVLRSARGDVLFWFGLLFPLLPVGILTLSAFVVRGDKHSTAIVPFACILAALAGSLVGIGFIRWGADTDSGKTAVLGVLAAAWLAMAYPLRSAPVIKGATESASRLRLYVWSAVLIWALITLVPAWSYTKLAIQNQGAVLVKTENLHVIEQLNARQTRIEDRYRGVSSGERVVEGRLAEDAGDVYWSPLYFSAEEENASRISNRDTAVCDPVEGGESPQTDVNEEFPRDLASPWLWSKVTRYLPVYSEASERMRFLEQRTGGYGEWCRLSSGEIRFEGRFGPVTSERRSILSKSPVEGVEFGWVSWVGFALIGLLLFRWVAYAARRLFFGAIPYEPPSSEDRLSLPLGKAGEPVRIILQVTSPRDEEMICGDSRSMVIDLSARPAGGRVGLEQARDAQVIVLTGVEALAEKDPDAVIDVLEEACEASGKVLLVLVYSDICSVLESELREEAADARPYSDAPAEAALRCRRLRRSTVLGRFKTMTLPVERAEGFFHALVSLHGPGEAGAAEAPPSRISGDPPGGTTGYTEHGLHRVYWQMCTRDEQLVLSQLAHEKFVNPKQEAAVRQLLDRGLLVRDPVLRIRRPSFEEYVAGLDLADGVSAMERDYEGLGWRQVQRILAGVILLLAAFLWTTQPTAVEAMVGLLSAVGIGAGALLKVFGAAGQLTGSRGESQ